MTQTIKVDFYDRFNGRYLGTRYFTKKVNDEPDELGNKMINRSYSADWHEEIPLPDNDEFGEV